MSHNSGLLRLCASARWREGVTLLFYFASASAGGLSLESQPANSATIHAAMARHEFVTTNNPDDLFRYGIQLRAELTRESLGDSIRMLQKSADIYRARLDRRGEAVAEIAIGDAFQMMSSYSSAEAAYQRALKASGGLPDLKCRSLNRLVRSYANIGSVMKAKSSSEDASQACRIVSSTRAEADFEEAQGEAAILSAPKSVAAAHFHQAIQLSIANGDVDLEALATLMLAATEPSDESGRQQSLAFAQSALDEFLTQGDQYGSARAHNLLGYFASQVGDIDRSTCHSLSALGFFEQVGDRDNAGVALDALGAASKAGGDFDAALDYYRKAEKQFASVGDTIGEAASMVPISEILLSRESYAGLPRLYSRKDALSARVGLHSLVGSGLIDQAGIDQRAHKYEKAISEYQDGFRQYELDGNLSGEGIIRMRQAALFEESGDFDKAITLLKEARVYKEQTREILDQAQIGFLAARIYLKENELESALGEIEKTIAIVESERLQITQFDSRAQYFASIHAYYALYIKALMALEQRSPNEAYAKAAFNAAERSKVRALLDSLGNSPAGAPCDKLMASLGDLDNRNNEPNGRGSNPRASVPALSLDQAQAEISGTDTVLLEYVLGEPQSYVWVVDSDGSKVYQLNSGSEIRRHVDASRQALMPILPQPGEAPAAYVARRHLASRSWQVEAAAISNLILGDVKIAPGKNVLIVPDGGLNYVPFSALPMPSGRGAGKLFGQEHTLTILPSVSVLSAIRKAAAGRPPPNDEVMVFADPLFEQRQALGPAPEQRTRSAPKSRDFDLALQETLDSSVIPRLPGSRSEGRAIRRLLGPARTRLVLGADANRDEVLSGSLERKRIIHFATHGIMDSRHPERSGLVLSLFNNRGEPRDGYLRLSDIYNLKLSADLVVLSSCDSALGKDLGSEGIIGLPRAFLFAGARRVVASLWKVDDEATASFMKAMYSRLRDGQSPSKALQGAQRTLANSSRFSSPFYWAAFTLEGDFK